jgi:hypothetical protein
MRGAPRLDGPGRGLSRLGVGMPPTRGQGGPAARPPAFETRKGGNSGRVQAQNAGTSPALGIGALSRSPPAMRPGESPRSRDRFAPGARRRGRRHRPGREAGRASGRRPGPGGAPDAARRTRGPRPGSPRPRRSGPGPAPGARRSRCGADRSGACRRPSPRTRCRSRPWPRWRRPRPARSAPVHSSAGTTCRLARGPAGAGWNPTKWTPRSPRPPQPVPAQVLLPVAAHVEVDQPGGRPQAEPRAQRGRAVAPRGDDHPDLDQGGEAGHRQGRRGAEDRRGVAVGRAQLPDQGEGPAAEPPGVGRVDLGPGEVGQQEPGDAGAAGRRQGDGRGVAEDRRRPPRRAGSGRPRRSGPSPRRGPGPPDRASRRRRSPRSGPAGSGPRRPRRAAPARPACAAARPSARRGPGGTGSSPADLAGSRIEHRHRAVEVAEAVAGHVDGEPPRWAIADLASRDDRWTDTRRGDSRRAVRPDDRRPRPPRIGSRPAPRGQDGAARRIRLGARPRL